MSTTEYKPGLSIEDLPPELRQKAPLKLASNENPLGPSPLALHAIRDSLDTLNVYPSKQLEWQLRQAIAASISDRLGPEHIVVGSGGIEVLEFVARSHLLAPPRCQRPAPAVVSFFGTIQRPFRQSHPLF
jgi:histidinol-phosphate aminotransferase